MISSKEARFKETTRSTRPEPPTSTLTPAHHSDDFEGATFRRFYKTSAHTATIMVSTPYTRGRSREYQALRKLRAEGWFCSRSAASHGPVDIFAGKNGRVLMVQVKSGKGHASKEERELLRVWGKAFRGRVEIWRFRKGRPLERQIVYSDD